MLLWSRASHSSLLRAWKTFGLRAVAVLRPILISRVVRGNEGNGSSSPDNWQNDKLNSRKLGNTSGRKTFGMEVSGLPLVITFSPPSLPAATESEGMSSGLISLSILDLDPVPPLSLSPPPTSWWFPQSSSWLLLGWWWWMELEEPPM